MPSCQGFGHLRSKSSENPKYCALKSTHQISLVATLPQSLLNKDLSSEHALVYSITETI